MNKNAILSYWLKGIFIKKNDNVNFLGLYKYLFFFFVKKRPKNHVGRWTTFIKTSKFKCKFKYFLKSNIRLRMFVLVQNFLDFL